MTKLLEQAVETARALPANVQDDIARIVLMIANEGQGVIALTKDEEASFDESLAQAARQEFATDAEVQAVWSKYSL